MFDDSGGGAWLPIQLAAVSIGTFQGGEVATVPRQMKTFVGSPVIGRLLADSTAMEPSTANLLVQTSVPAESTSIACPLSSGLLNILKLSPATRGGP